MPAWTHWMAVVYLPLSTIALLWFLWKAYACKELVHRMEFITYALATLYPMGVGFKLLVLGPQFLRFHLSDFGFPISLGVALGLHAAIRYTSPAARGDYVALTERLVAQLSVKRYMLIVALVLSYGYELFEGYFYAGPGKGTEVHLVGSFDWMDMLMYTLGFGVAYLLLCVASQRAHTYRREEYALREQQERAAKAVRRATAKSSVTTARQRKQPRKKSRR